MGPRSGDSAEQAVALVRGHLEAWMRGDIDAMDAFTGEDFIQWHSMIDKDIPRLTSLMLWTDS